MPPKQFNVSNFSKFSLKKLKFLNCSYWRVGKVFARRKKCVLRREKYVLCVFHPMSSKGNMHNLPTALPDVFTVLR